MARDIPLKYAVMWENVNVFHSFYQCEIKFNSDFCDCFFWILFLTFGFASEWLSIMKKRKMTM